MHQKLDDANGTAPTESLQTGSAEETNVKPPGSDGEENNSAKNTENDEQTEQEEEEEEILPDLGDDDDDDDDLDLPAPVSAV